MRSSKHARIPPTREIFIPATNGTEVNVAGTHTGYLIDDDQENALIEIYVPHDYHGLVEMAVVLISGVALTPMTMNISTNYCEKNEVYNRSAWGATQKSINTGLDSLHELDISEFVIEGNDGVTQRHAIEAGDYIGVAVSRTSGQNTNALILGVRFRYKVFTSK